MNFSSNELYDGKLIAFDGVKSRLLVDIENIQETDDTSTPLVFIDTAGFELYEKVEIDDGLLADSKMNEGEADLVVKHVEDLLSTGLGPSDIAIISPYNAQVNLLKLALKNKYPALEIGSVDGFQGREKEAIIISLVRSNDKGEIGFLEEKRRLNVALTRAKRHLCVIGDSGTVSQRSVFLKKMVLYFEEHGDVRYPEM